MTLPADLPERSPVAVEEHVEIERKYDVPEDAPVPDLGGVPGVHRVTRAVALSLDATYFDTEGLALARVGITLRRRTGGSDAGWHLKLPGSGGGRTEVRLPLGDSVLTAPEPLLDRVRVFVREHEVVPVVTLRSRRVVHQLLGGDGVTLAEFCDDHVSAEFPSDERRAQWREWEIELVEGDERLLDAAEEVLRKAGIQRAASSSKLARALGLPECTLREPPSRKRLRTGTTGELLSAYVTKHLDRLLWEDVRARSGDAEGVHQMRVAARRLGSGLALCRELLPAGAVDGLRSELRWLGGALAMARDAEVMRARLDDLVQQQPPELVVGPVRRRLAQEAGVRLTAGRAEADRALTSNRYYRLLDQLESFSDTPLTGGPADRPAARRLPHLLHRDVARVVKRHRAVQEATTAHARNLALHDVRKAAKRLRYAAEAAQPVFGKPAERLALAAEALQEVLGEHQDTVVARAVLREVAIRAHEAGEDNFTFGRLHALEESRAATLAEEYPRVMARLPTGRLAHHLEA